MSEMQMKQAPVQTPGTLGQKGPVTHETKQKRRKLIRRCIAGAVAVAIAAASAWALHTFVFQEDDGLGEVMTAMVYTDSIRSVVDGTGTARAKNSAVITPEAGTNVLELLVAEGDQVEEGQLLYNLDDTAAREAVKNAQEAVNRSVTILNDQQKKLAELTVRAPHPGKLVEVSPDLRVGADADEGALLATLVNDTQLRLRLYYSWAYEDMMTPGQAAEITIPALMTSFPGKVEQVNYVRRVVPEGSVTFEVVFLLDNPGTLTEGTLASAALTAADGTPIYPYENGKLEYLETTKLTVPAGGPILWNKMMNYADVQAGQALMQIGDTTLSVDIAKQQELVLADQQALDEAQKKLENYHAVAPISGRVLACPLMAGVPVADGQSIQIADTSTMLVDINVDERHVGFVTPGMMVDLQDQMDHYYMGTIEQIALTAKSENGVAVFPATVTVDNPEGSLFTGTYVQYKFIASQSDNCLVVPVQAVIKVSLPDPSMGDMGEGEMGMDAEMDGEMGMDAAPDMEVMPDMGMDGMMGGGMGGFEDPSAATVCFVQGEPDDRAIPADEAWQVPEGFFPVVVETGLSDDTNVEIKSGLYEGDTVFTGYVTDSAYTDGMY